MKVEVKKLPRSQVELTIEIDIAEYQPFLNQAVKTISEQIKIPGFRPGKAGFETVKQKVGENEIWQEALEPAVKKTFLKALHDNQLNTVGPPQVDVVKLAPGNPVIYKATVSLFPDLKLADYKKIKIEKKPVEVSTDQVQKFLAELQRIHAKEVLVDRPAQKGDKAEIDFDAFMDKIPIESGSAKKYPLVVGENTFIPGFEEQLIGLSKDDSKEFQLKFPENYHQKNLAGKPVDFKVKVLAIYERQLPELNDETAKSISQCETLTELKNKVKANLQHEFEHKADRVREDELIDKIIEQSEFEDIPDILIDSESKRMAEELEHNVSTQGLKFEDYLDHIQKTRPELILDFVPQAIKRVKGSLIMKKVADQEQISATQEEINREIEKDKIKYADNDEILTDLKRPEYHDYLNNIITAKKVMGHLESVMVKQK